MARTSEITVTFRGSKFTLDDAGAVVYPAEAVGTVLRDGQPTGWVIDQFVETFMSGTRKRRFAAHPAGEEMRRRADGVLLSCTTWREALKDAAREIGAKV